MQVCCNDNSAGAYSHLVSTSTGSPASVTFDRVTKVYDNVTALEDFSLEVEAGEFMVFVGPSGCGKTTALRMVAGLEEITAGEIAIGDETVNELDPRQRDVAMVFQNYALYPHMTVFDNIAFGLRARRAPKSEIRRRVESAGQALGLADLLQRKPRQLSGGQRQRVAMGRAIVRQPRVFLMDEPLSNLDARLRVQMRAEVARVQRELGVTTIYVTHDQVEAMTMGDRVAVMRSGVLQQTGDPQVVFDRPANLFVASFIGSPPMNLVEAQLAESGDGLAVARRRAGAADPRRDGGRASRAAGLRRAHDRPRRPAGAPARGERRRRCAPPRRRPRDGGARLRVPRPPRGRRRAGAHRGGARGRRRRRCRGPSAARVGGDGAAHGGDRAARDTAPAGSRRADRGGRRHAAAPLLRPRQRDRDLRPA